MTTSVGRPAVAVLLPGSELEPVAAELRNGGFDPIQVTDGRDLAVLLAARRDVVVAVIDVEATAGHSAWTALADSGRHVPGLLVVGASTLMTLEADAAGREDDEYLTRPYSAESIRWRV